VSWIFITVVSLVWGRGVFCGWVCPYGAMSELTRKLVDRLKIPRYELPTKAHRKLRYLRYGVLAVLVVSFLVSPVTGERWAEIEPFKSTFLVPFWGREWLFAGWWVLLFVASLGMYRPFCRYLCPMGAGLAILGSLRLSGPYRRAHCGTCKICEKGCEPKAIEPDGTIDPRECLSCMECEQTYRDRDRCPPLIGIDRLLAKPQLGPREEAKLVTLRKQEQKVPWRPGQ
jgi:NosR/NirI family nitrous oxide reductase transcriptional regulator